MFKLSRLIPPQHVFIQRGVCFMPDDVLLGHIMSHLIMCLWGCGVVGVPRCECVDVWGYIYTLFTLISEQRGTNKEMCGLERGKPGSACFFGRQ